MQLFIAGIKFKVDDLPNPSNRTSVGNMKKNLQLMASAFQGGFVGHGFDLRTGRSLARLGGDPTYHERKEFFYPYTNSTLEIPDDITLAISSLGCAQLGYQLYLSAEAIANFWLEGSVGLLDIKLFGIKAGLTFADLKEHFFTELDAKGKIMVSIEVGFELMKASPNIDEMLSPSGPFVQAIANLPSPNTTGSEGAYTSFLDRWGTHYVSSQSFGGYCNFTAKLDASMAAKLNQTVVLKKAVFHLQALFQKLDIDIRDGAWRRFFNISKNFNWTSQIDVDFHCQGGDPTILGTASNPSNGSFPAWLKSVLLAPTAISRPTARRLRPIAGLVASDILKRQALYNATIVYLNVNKSGSRIARLQETKENVYIAKPDSHLNVSGDMILRWLPGVCNGVGGVGVGCGFDITDIAGFGSANVNPKRPVVHMPHCKLECYVKSPPNDPDCNECIAEPIPASFMPDGKPMQYRVPSNVLMLKSPVSGACFDSNNFSYVDEYQASFMSHWSHSGIFSSHSKTVKRFYHEYFEQDNSMSVSYLFNMWHQVALANTIDSPTWEFRVAVAKLPIVYEGHEDKYRTFLQQFGTHYMDVVSMGGSALLTAFYHSCFLNTYNSTDIFESSSHSFFFIFNSGSGTHKHGDINRTQWQHWSKVEMLLNGGEVLGHGRLTRSNTLTGEQCSDWEQTIKSGRMVPLQFHLRPITDLMISQKIPFESIKVRNVNRSIVEYIQSAKDVNDNLVKDLIPKDPYCVPPWCTFKPKPDFPVQSSIPLPTPQPPPYKLCNRSSYDQRVSPRGTLTPVKERNADRQQRQSALPLVGELPACPSLLSRKRFRQLRDLRNKSRR